MSLDTLKDIWNKTEPSYSKAELKSIFEIKTRRQVKSVNKIMLLDYALMTATALVLIATTFLLGLKSRYFITFEIVGLSTVMAIHYWIKYRLLNPKSLQHKDLKSTIEQLIKRLKGYLIAYKVIIPFMVSAVYLRLQYNLMSLQNRTPQESIIELLFVVPIAVLCYLFVQWLSAKMYGTQLSKLKNNFSQLRGSSSFE